MTEEELKLREGATRREYPETDAAFERVRATMVAKLFTTTMLATEEREALYRSVQTLDAVKAAMIEALGQGSQAIDEYAKTFATTKPE